LHWSAHGGWKILNPLVFIQRQGAVLLT